LSHSPDARAWLSIFESLHPVRYSDINMTTQFLFLYDDTPLPHPYTAEQKKTRIAALHCIDVLHANGMNHSEAIASVCTVLQQLRIA
jgi:hypothetical protein